MFFPVPDVHSHLNYVVVNRTSHTNNTYPRSVFLRNVSEELLKAIREAVEVLRLKDGEILDNLSEVMMIRVVIELENHESNIGTSNISD